VYKCKHGSVFNQYALELMTYLSERGYSFPLQIHDIPYDVSVKSADIKFKNRADMYRDFGDWDAPVDLPSFAKACSQIASVNSNVVVFFNNWPQYSTLINELAKYFDGVDSLVWYKTNPRPQVRKRKFTANHELLVWAYRGSYTLNFTEHADMMSANKFPRELCSLVENSLAMGRDRLRGEDNKPVHKTQKPVKLVQYYIEKLSNPGDIVLDAYAGVLTTAVAAMRSGRRFVVNDLCKEFVDIGIKWIKESI
jgi:site-specific DNA-methyltransferase (adenine-specific)